MRARWPSTVLTERLGITYPIVQAPMASISLAPLAAAASAAGGLGTLGSATMTTIEVEEQARAVRARTDRPFALNFFVHRPPAADEARLVRLRERLEPYRRALGAEPFPDVPLVAPPFGAAMLETVLAIRPAVVSFHFGLPEPSALGALRSAGIPILASATTVEEARVLEAAGADAVIAQGFEAGGHRGTFASSFPAGEVGTMALVPQVVDAVSVPVIAAGGIADGRGIAAALTLGAAAVQMGTAFLRCPEAEIDPIYRRALSEPRARDTRLTRAFTGRPARAIANTFIDEMAGEVLPDFPLPRAFTAVLGKAARAGDNPELLAMWAGQAAALARPLPAADVMAALVRETVQALA